MALIPIPSNFGSGGSGLSPTSDPVNTLPNILKQLTSAVQTLQNGIIAPVIKTNASSLTINDFTTRRVDLDNTYSWEVETNTTPGGGTNVAAGDSSNFSNGGAMRLTASNTGNQVFCRIAGGGLGSTTSPGKFCQLLNPQGMPVYLGSKFALSCDSANSSGIIWLIRIQSVKNAPSTDMGNFGVAWSGTRQMLQIRSESPLGSTQEYQIPMTFDHAPHLVEVFTDSASMSVHLDNTLVRITDHTLTGLTGANASGTSLPLPFEMPPMASIIDWGVNNISDVTGNFGAIYYNITYGWMERLGLGSVR